MKPTAIRRAMLAVVWMVASTSAILSYSGIRELALGAGFGQQLSWLLPLSIDGLVLAGALVVLDAEAKKSSKTFGWALTITGVLASVAANIAVVAGLIPMLAHAAPPIILALTLEAWLHTMRADVRSDREAAEHVVEPVVVEVEPVVEVAVQPVIEPQVDTQPTAVVLPAPVKRSAPSTPRTRNPIPPVGEVMALKAEGKSHQVIADSFGVSKSSITRLVATASLTDPAGPDPTWVG